MEKKLKKIYKKVKKLLENENPYILRKDCIEWTTESFFVILKVNRGDIHILSPSTTLDAQNNNDAAKTLQHLYLEHYLDDQSLDLSDQLAAEANKQGIDCMDIEAVTGIEWVDVDGMMNGCVDCTIRDLHIIAKALNKKLALVDA